MKVFFFLLQATNSSKVLKTRDSAFLSADLQGERGAEEKEEERDNGWLKHTMFDLNILVEVFLFYSYNSGANHWLKNQTT